jgi:hypothetical protein
MSFSNSPMKIIKSDTIVFENAFELRENKWKK